MSNYREYNGKIAFHPGYYIEEIVEESGLTQTDFAKSLGTTPKNLSVLISGEQNLSIDIATKLARMLGTTVTYWLNIQQKYDEIMAEIISDNELAEEREVFKLLDYKYFRENFNCPDLPRKTDEQIKCVRERLRLSSLTMLGKEDLAVSFRSYTVNLSNSNIVKANAMVQIGINKTLEVDAPKFDKRKFEKAVKFALTQTRNHATFLPEIKEAFYEAGVVLIALPNMAGSGINGATKKVDGKVMLLVTDRRHYADTFWFTLFHEIGHIMNGEYGITFEHNKNVEEDAADTYAQRALIPQGEYEDFVKKSKHFTKADIKRFADSIKIDPGIVVGRLLKDEHIDYKDSWQYKELRHTYSVVIRQ